MEKEEKEKRKLEIDKKEQKKSNIFGQKLERKSKTNKDTEIESLFKQNEEILTEINELQKKLISIDKDNKKFLLTATVNDDRVIQLKEEIIRMKIGIINILDQVYILLSVIDNNATNDFKNGLKTYCKTITEIINNLGIEEIPVIIGTQYNPQLQESIKNIFSNEYEEDIIAELLQRGYFDKETGNILRYAKVNVYKKNRKEEKYYG